MANPEHLAILSEGINAWNDWRDGPSSMWVELSSADLQGTNLANANLTGAHLTGAKLINSILSYANFSDANLSGADLTGTHALGTNFNRANLSGVNLINANLFGANFTNANLNSANLLSAKLRGVEFIRADLTGVNLAAVNCSCLNFKEANFSSANLARTDFSCADLTKTNLSRANLSGAYLINANLTGADLSYATLSRANLAQAEFSNAIFRGTILTEIDLSSAINVESTRHHGPSSLSIDTLVRSKGNISEIFLRRAGVPESFITNMKSLISAMEPIQFYSCFISYSMTDQDFADRLHADLQAKGVRCWFAPHDVRGGRKLHEQIDEAIQVYDKLLLILSEASMNSNWVKTEIANARAREQREKRQMLFPLAVAPFDALKQWKCFDADTGIDSAREIREYFIPDFSNWKDHDSYQKAFERLVKDLQAASEAQSA